MDLQTLVLIIVGAVIGAAWWVNYSKRGKIYCTFIGVDKTSIHKFVKKSSEYVVFDGKRRNIIPKCIVWDDWRKGLFYSIFPATVATLTYSYNSPLPIDPETLQPMILSAEVRQLMNKEELWRNYNKTLSPGSVKKQTIIQQWLPWITLAALVLLAVYVVVNNQAFGKALTDITNRLNEIQR